MPGFTVASGIKRGIFRGDVEQIFVLLGNVSFVREREPGRHRAVEVAFEHGDAQLVVARECSLRVGVELPERFVARAKCLAVLHLPGREDVGMRINAGHAADGTTPSIQAS